MEGSSILRLATRLWSSFLAAWAPETPLGFRPVSANTSQAFPRARVSPRDEVPRGVSKCAAHCTGFAVELLSGLVPPSGSFIFVGAPSAGHPVFATQSFGKVPVGHVCFDDEENSG